MIYLKEIIYPKEIPHHLLSHQINSAMIWYTLLLSHQMLVRLTTSDNVCFQLASDSMQQQKWHHLEYKTRWLLPITLSDTLMVCAYTFQHTCDITREHSYVVIRTLAITQRHSYDLKVAIIGMQLWLLFMTILCGVLNVVMYTV